MRRARVTVLALVAAAGIAVIPAAVHAAMNTAGPSRSIASARSPIKPMSESRRITLTPAQCAAVRRTGHNKKTTCTATESKGIRLLAATANTYYFQGWLQTCAIVESNGACDPHNWWVKDTFYFTDAPGTGVWSNGSPYCQWGGTTVSWCSYTNNGQNPMVEGYNFGPGGTGDYSRMFLYASNPFNATKDTNVGTVEDSWKYMCANCS